MAQELLYKGGMNNRAKPRGISAEEWAATPVAVQELVVSLLATVEQLQKRIADLEELLNKTSQNSSKPPSSDPLNAPSRPKRTRSGRQRGGQKGHKGHGRSLKPAEQVDHIVEVRPLSCARCGVLLLGEGPKPLRHQVTELPRIKPKVTEYRRHTVRCICCGAHTQADWPSDMPKGSFGPRLQATVGYLTGRIGTSQRDTTEMMEILFHTAIALGSIPALEQRVSTALRKPVEGVQTYVQKQAVVNIDETGWHEKTKRIWLWVVATALVSVFRLLPSRGSDSVEKMLGKTFKGIAGSDRWTAYNSLDVKQRQLCWAHLKRDFQALLDRGVESKPIGGGLLKKVGLIFKSWYRLRDGILSREEFQLKMQPIQRRVGQLLREGAKVSHDKTRRTCQNILKLEDALWTFVWVEGVEPTNNAAERPLRRAVLWRRRSFGTQSKAGSRFVERVLTTVTTSRQQERDVLDYLTHACAASIRGDQSPSLLPTT